MRLFLLLALPFLIIANPLKAAPKVVTDIAPVHSLVAAVMGELAEPNLLLKQNASPHHASLRPSQAQALADADLVIYIGDALTPWLTDPVNTLAIDAQKLVLLSPDMPVIGYLRSEHDHSAHDEHDSDEEHGHASDDKHDADEEHGHDTENKHDSDDDHGSKEDDGHSAPTLDPHAWLSPSNAQYWLGLIANKLGELDPKNATTYNKNARKAHTALGVLQSNLRKTSGKLDQIKYLTYHDGLQYYELQFLPETLGSLTSGDHVKPSAGHIKNMADKLNGQDVTCVMVEQDYNPKLVEAIFGDNMPAIAIIDLLGATVEPGPDLYLQLIKNLSSAIDGACLN